MLTGDMDIHEKRRSRMAYEAKMRRLQQEIAAVEAACTHQWSEPEYVPDKVPDVQFDHFEGAEPNPQPIYRHVGDRDVPRWRQICTVCGAVRYTTKLKRVDVVPDFS